MVPLAFADEAEGAAASPSVGSEVAPPTDKEASLNKALDDVATLEAGTDYDPGTMLALIDGAAVQADGSPPCRPTARRPQGSKAARESPA